MHQSITQIVRKAEVDFLKSSTLISRYVVHSAHLTLERIDAYLNNKFTTGDKDALKRDKPFFNIVNAACNIWYRATDINTSHIRLRASESKHWINAFLATAVLRDWMRRDRFATFLNEWGRVLARYGSAVVKTVKNKDGLHLSVVPWNTLIFDAVDFAQNPVIEVLNLTEQELRDRVNTMGYNKEQVEQLAAHVLAARQTLDRAPKDMKNDFVKIYEVHGNFPLAHITNNPADNDTFVPQMHVVSFVGVKVGRKTEYQDFTLYSGREEKSPYRITHLIKEDGRSLGRGAVENLFEAQWMVNHSMKAIKDNLDLSTKLVLQTTDPQFLGRNFFTNINDGAFMITDVSRPITRVDNSKPDIMAWNTFAGEWRQVGQEINNISDAMLGQRPHSGTSWRMQQMLLNESYALFELMTENKGNHIVDMFREDILPYIKSQLNHADEIAAILDAADIQKLDSRYITNKAAQLVNKHMFDRVIAGQDIQPGEQEMMMQGAQSALQQGLQGMDDQRFFSPSDMSDKTWAAQLEDFVWDLEVSVTDEETDAKGIMQSLSTALQIMMNPNFAQNKQAQAVVARIFELSGGMSPLEFSNLPLGGGPQGMPVPSPMQPIGGSNGGPLAANVQ